eukprot:CAMPEP_0197651060 /NCGR_PEP_ID=MMETSP1338-20131121/31331_1 /TAXON_ID=43686 ORGANISM="Pelagodinium beii, Strain RCC1491" /NCGR_SAMPLE_ID=MMETSP1338 /ASSEMBLY_ACC=CAM_ASM_000754 /LENGTH=75 /DNA_ID=CAMNT_0043225611 /DNA_START=72 /DNA_END=299 /DNA_ORIENTATION=-
MAGGCAIFCTVMSAVAVPVLLFIGVLSSQKSMLIEIPDHMKPDAGKGCFVAAAMYAVTFVFAYMQMKKPEKVAAA